MCLTSERATRGLPRAITAYESLLEDWQNVVATVASKLGLSWPRRGAMVEIEIEQFLSTQLRHHTITPARLTGKPEVVDWVKEAYATLTSMAEKSEHQASMARLDQICGAFEKASAAFGVPLAMAETELALIRNSSEELKRERGQLAAALEEEKAAAARNNAQAALQGQELEALRNAVREHETAATKLRADLDSAQSVSNDRERERGQLAAALEEEKAAAARNNAQAALQGQELEALRNAVREHETAATKLRADLDSAQSLSNDRERERGQLAAALEEEITEAVRTNAQIALLGQELKTLRTAVLERETAATKLRADLDSAQSLSNDRNNEIDKLSRELMSGQSAIRDRDREIDRLSHDLDATRLFLRDSQAEIQRLAGELDTAQAEIERANAARQRVSDAFAVASRELVLVRSRAERLQKKREELRLTATQLTDARGEIAALKAALEDAAALAESENKAQAQIRVLRDQVVDAEAALAKSRKGRNGPSWTRLLSPSKLRAKRQLMKSGLFDAEWYLREYLEVAESGRSAAEHYLEEGYLRGCRPNPLFDTRWYLERYEDVRRSGVNPLLHYLKHGFREGRDPGPGFQTDFYLGNQSRCPQQRRQSARALSAPWAP